MYVMSVTTPKEQSMELAKGHLGEKYHPAF